MSIVETLRRRKRRFIKSLLSGLTVSILLSFASYLGYLDIIEAKALDLLMQLRGQQRSPEIVLVQIDDLAFEKLKERQPLPRSYLASLIEVAARGGAKVIGLDIELKVATDSTEDAHLLKAIQSAEESKVSRVVLVYGIRPEREDDRGVLYGRSSFFDKRLNVVAGFANASVESDGFVRRIPLVLRGADGKMLPSFALAVLARHAGYDPSALDRLLASAGKIALALPQWDRLQGRLLTDKTSFEFVIEESWRINFAGGRGSFVSLPSEPVAQIAKAQVPLASDNPFRDKIVLIGASFQESRDVFPTPRGLMSGLEIHANIIHTILTRSQILPARRVVAFSILMVFTLLTSLLVTLLRPKVVTFLTLAAIPIVLLPLSYLAFAQLGMWVDFIVPLLATTWGASAAERLESRQVRKSLGQYVGWEVAKQLVEQDEPLSGNKCEVTVFFTDVRNFTTLCEGLPPEQVVVRMNTLFAMMGKAIARHDGIILDFIGDAVLAVFGTPKRNPHHARNAVRTSIEILAGLDALNAQWEKRGIAPLKIGVGLHTGEVVASIVGTDERKKFDITGDTVNIGSRVEGLNKEFGTVILATRETVDRLDGAFAVRGCGQVKVKGRENPVEVFELLGSATIHKAAAEVL